MVEARPRSDLFPCCGCFAKQKILLLGSPSSLSENVMSRVRSLQLEHVSPASLMRPEISRHARFGLVTESAVLAALRRWFWTRKPDAGFFLTDFPATLLQAQVFDEWLATRGENLSTVLTVPSTSSSLIEYYLNFGLINKLGFTS